MKIKELFSTKIQEKIEPVVKVGDMENDTKIANELGSYVVTPSIEKFLDILFDHYTDTFYTDTDEIGIWISGYFGSGKSYLAKIIALLTENREINGVSASERFGPRIDKASPYGPGILRHLSTIKNVDTEIFAFNINTLADSNDSHLAQLLLANYYQSKGYSSNIIYAHVIERELDKQGKIDDLHSTISEISGEPWDTIRSNPTFYRRSFYEAACKIAPEAFTCVEDVEDALRVAFEGEAINVQNLVQILVDDLRVKEERIGKRARVMFVLDEMGQWFGDVGAKLYQLQALVEEAAIKGRGRIWITVTTHEKMEDIIETAGKLRPDTKKIESRFQNSISLTTENIELVLQDRLLKKNIAGKSELEKIYNINSGMLRGLGQLADSTQILPECDLDNFVTYYPFLPYHIHIIPDVVKSLRSQGGRGEQLSGSTRTLLAIAQDIIRTGRRPYLEKGIGDLVTFDEVFENLASDGEINPEIRKDIRDIEKEVPGASSFTRKVAEVLFLVRDLPYVIRTCDNISRLLLEDISQDLTIIKPKVEKELTRLIEAEMVSVAGTEYEFLTGERRSFEKEVRVRKNQIKHQDRLKGIMEFATQTIGFKTIEYLNTEFDVKTKFDDNPINTKGSIEIKYYSPYLAATGINITDLENRSLRSDENHSIYVLSNVVPHFDNELNYYIAMSEVIQSWKGDSGKTQYERNLALERENKQLQNIKQSILGMINKGFSNCHIIHKGQARTIVVSNQKASNKIRQEVANYWPSLYERFNKVPVRLANERKDILDILVGNTRLSNEAKKLGLYDPSHQVNINAPLLDELRIYLSTQEIHQIRTTGRTLLERFSKPPYGWDEGVVRVGLAALVRNGNVLILINKKAYENPKDSQLQEALRNAREFNRVEIELVDVDVPLDILIETRETLIRITGDKKIEETISGLTEAFKKIGEKVTQTTSIINIWAGPAGYPIPELFNDTGKKITDIIQLPNNARTVDEIHKNRELLEKGFKLIEEVKEFQEEKGTLFLDMKEFHDDVTIIEHKLEENSTTKQFITNYEAATTQRNFSDSSVWKTLQQSREASRIELVNVQIMWKDEAKSIIQNLASEIPSLLEENGIHPSKSTGLLNKLDVFTTEINNETDLSKVSILPTKANQLAAKIRTDILNMIEIKSPPPTVIKPVEKVSIANISLGRRISNTGEWLKLLEKLDEKVKEILDKGKDVELI